jgi:hypothetical protein
MSQPFARIQRKTLPFLPVDKFWTSEDGMVGSAMFNHINFSYESMDHVFRSAQAMCTNPWITGMQVESWILYDSLFPTDLFKKRNKKRKERGK